MKKILLGAALLMTGLFAKAQGLENVIVEKYYVSNAADAAGSVGTLPVGSVTYRVFADMLPGYSFQAAFGLPGQFLTVQTTTTFFNNEDYGSTTPTINTTNVRKNSALLDSYFSVGGAATGRMAVLKVDDTDGSPGNAQGILQNSDGTFTAINIGTTASAVAKDGMVVGTPVAVTYVGMNNTGNGDLGVLDGLSQVGGLFTTNAGSVAALGGAVGVTPATNHVLIGQFTTDGVFSFQLNIQLGTPSGGSVQYAATNPTGTQQTAAFLSQTHGAANTPPTVSITSPANGASFLTGASVAIAATAADADGTVTQVEFFVGATSVGIDNTPGNGFTATYTAANGTHCITATATDNSGATTTTGCTNITVASNPPPVVNITAPANGSNFITGSTVSITANATDNGSVAQVQFFVDGVSVGIVTGAGPYAASYTAAIGPHCITATATDNLGATSTTPCTNITVANNPAPNVTITAPAAGSTYITGATVAISATATDNGTVSQVEFFVDGVSVGIDNSGPSYTASYLTSTLGTRCITATATDNLGATATTPCRNINVVSSILPYEIVTTNATCLPATFCTPIAAVTAVDNVIGYDIVLNYDATKVVPTGVITNYSALAPASQYETINSFAAGVMNISVYFNGTAPATAEFNGIGNLICVEFSKLAAFTSVDTVTFSVSSLQESYFTGVQNKFVNDGDYSTFKDTTYNAGLRFWLDNSALGYDNLNPATFLITNIYGTDAACANQSLVAVQPNTAGNFSHNTANGLSVSIQRDILAATDVQPVINGFDAFLVKKVLINDISFIPNIYQAIANDVNLDGVLSAGDLTQINQRTVLIIAEFRQAWNYNQQGQSNGQPSKDWMFVDTVTVQTNPAYTISATYPANDGVGFSKAQVPVVAFCLPINVTNYAVCPLIVTTNYKGILLGDVNGNFATVGSGGVFRATAGERVTFDMSKAEVANGFVTIPVSLSSNSVVNSLDFAMQFNGAALSFNSTAANNSSIESLSHFNVADKTLRFTSFSLNAYEQNAPVASVRFAANNAADVTENDLSNLVGYINGEQVAVEVISRSGVSSLTTSGNNVSIYPNPANNVLFVQVIENAVITLMDATGRTVMMQTAVNANEKLQINTSDIASGVYMVKVSADTFTSVKRVVIKK